MAATPRARRLARRPKIATTAVSLAAVLALTLAGCGSDSEGGSSSAEDSADASYGEISVQYSWIKNEEFAGEFYADENGYYDEAGFDAVNGISGPDTGVAKLLCGTVAGRAQRRRLDRRGDRRAGRPAEDHRRDVPEEPVHDPVAQGRRRHRDARGPDRQEDRRPGLQRQRVRGAARRPTASTRAERRGRAGRLRPDPADERRGRRLHGLPDQRGDHGRASPATRSPTCRTPTTACRTSPRPISVTDDVPRREPGAAEGVPDRRDQGLDRRRSRSRPTTRVA